MSILKNITFIKNFILDLLFPVKCHVCGKDGSYLCKNCFKKIPLIRQSKCPLCYQASSEGFLCFRCQKKTYLERIILASDYKNLILKETIHIFKYESIRDLAEPLGQLLAESLRKNQLVSDFDIRFSDFILVPVPLHKTRLAERGFNQAELLAQVMGRELNLEIINFLMRKNFLTPQTDLKDRQKRKENIKNAFSLALPKEQYAIKFPLPAQDKLSETRHPPSSLSHKDNYRKVRNNNIILIDDVITTGATIQEAAKVLKKAGAKKIWALALAQG